MEPARERWESWTETPLTIAALIFLAAYAIPIVWPETPMIWSEVFAAMMTTIWAFFGVDYIVRLLASKDRWGFVRSNLVDLVIIVLPLLRQLRLLRLITVLSVLNRTSARTLRGRVVVYLVGGTSLLLLMGGLAVTDAERGVPGANITGFGDGMWWAASTMTSVGYGDVHPVTMTGRFVAVVLMMGGIALLGVITATFASWLLARIAEDTEQEQAATRAQVDALAQEVALLREHLSEPRLPTRP